LHQDPFDHVAQARRQPGSTFKPFVYGAAFDQGMSPGEVLMDEPVEIALGGGQVWRPTDGGRPASKPMTLRDGLAVLKNTITAQLMQQVGPSARGPGARHGRAPEPPGRGALAGAGHQPGDAARRWWRPTARWPMAALHRAHVLITRIEDRDGKVLEDFAPPAPEPALRARGLHLLDALRGVVDRGTGVAIRAAMASSADVAGKTGTTQDNTDGWFILMHPQLVAGAWVGFNDSRITLRSDYWGQGAPQRAAHGGRGPSSAKLIPFGAADFDCKFGLTAEAATPAHLATVIPQLDAAAREGATSVYVEILARAAKRKPRPAGEAAHDVGEGAEEPGEA
jgi:penicillin-binding protein 1A